MVRPRELNNQRKFLQKKRFFTVDGPVCPARLLTPPEAGLPGRKTRELVLAFFGTANWNSILSRHDERSAPREGVDGQAIIAGEKLGFFVARNSRRVYPEEFRGWFFDIYIQGSKYNFKS